MIQLDPHTLLHLMVLQTAVLGFAALAVARDESTIHLRPWGYSVLVQCAAFVAFDLRGDVSDWISVVGANVALALSLGLQLQAISRFNAGRLPVWTIWGPTVVVAIVFSLLIDHQSARNIAAGLLQGGMLAWMTIVLLRRGTPLSGPGQRLLAASLIAIALLYAMMLLRELGAARDDPMQLKAQHWLQVALLSTAVFSVLGATLGFMLMVLQKSNRLARDRAAELMAIFDSVTEAITLFGRDGTILRINAAGATRLGKRPEELVGRHIGSVWPPELVAPRMQRVEQVCTSGQPETFIDDRQGRVFDVHLSPVTGTRDRVVVYSKDITRAKRTEQNLAFLARRAQALLDLPRLADELDEAEFMQRGLELSEELTGSVISFIHFVNEEEGTIELVTWSRRTLKNYCTAAYDRHYPVDKAGIWADAVRRHEPVIFNDYASASGKRGLPDGHARLERLISLPVLEGGRVVMIAGVGNKPENYTPEDVETVQLLANDVWRLVQRRRNQRQLGRFTRLIERSLNEIYSFDAQTLHFVDANRGALENIGYSLDELREMTPLDIKPDISPDDFAALLAPLRTGAAKLQTLTTLHRRKDGSSYPAEVHLELTSDANPVFVAVVRDISERVRNEHALQQALKTVEASPVLTFRWRAAAGWPVEFVSANITRWGYREEQMLAGAPRYADIVHPEDLPRVVAEVTENTRKGIDAYTQEYRIRHADGHYFWVDDHTRILRDADGTPKFYEGVVNDVDEKKIVELDLAANLAHQVELNRKLEEAHNQLLQSEKMASIGQLAAGVAHELNNPIGFVHSNLGTLEHYLRDIFEIASICERVASGECDIHAVEAMKKEKDFDFLKQDIFQLMSESRDGLDRVKKIVQDLKDFSRVGEANWQWADLHRGLDSTLNIVWNELKYKCTVTKRYAESLPQIRCLPSQLNQVFMNLLVNAAHAIPEKGEITISTELLDDERVRIRIADTGTGIAPENMKHLFEPFFTTKPVGKGTGLGLSIAWGIVGRHHGTIEVDSALGRGTAFTITLPVDPPVDDGTATGTEPPVPPSSTPAPSP